MAQTAAHLVDHALALPPGRSPGTNSPLHCLCSGSLPHVPVRQWVLSLPIPLRLLLAAQPKLVTPVLQVVHRVITRHLLGQAGLKAEQADSGAVTLIQPSLWMKGSAANLNIHLHCLVLDGVYRCGAEGEPVFVEVPAPTDEALLAVLHKIITRLTHAADPQGGARRRAGPDRCTPRPSRACRRRWPRCVNAASPSAAAAAARGQ